jgi:serine/threonine protein kinase/predicted negative regulator of RcsB-dependent stress response
MDSDRWQKINELFHASLDLSKGERLQFLKKECIDDAKLFEEVQKLIKAHQKAYDFIENAAVDKAFGLLATEQEETKSFVGQQFGVYKIIKEIGRGGMGAVFLAKRDDKQFEKRVAIKIIKRGMDTEEVLKRFRTERQILASLEHSNIARLLDGGTTDNDLPYFVMEYIEGLPITKYADKHKLSIKKRLELFRQVASAVAYAHQRLIIHRDIKSSNIIVTKDGIPKLLDFGIAKLISPDMFSNETPATATGMQLMTPEYASPEQFKGENATTSTDIYSLGVVLFELLTGQRPFDKYFREFGKIYKAVIETDPPKPSEVILENQTNNFALNNNNATQNIENLSDTKDFSKNKTSRIINTNQSLNFTNPKLLRGDLDNIILKALRKETENRYLTVEQFSEDIRRHLVGLPVIARPLSLKYRLTKFIGRNKISVGLGTIIVLTLISGIFATTWQSIRANRQKELAEKRFREVRKLANTVLFDYHDSIKDLPGSTPVRAKIVRDALEYLDSLASEASDDISLQKELAAAYERVGDVQGGTMVANLGDTEGAIKSYKKSLKIREDILTIEPNGFEAKSDVALSCVKLGILLWELGNMKAALENTRRALEIFQSLEKEYPGNPETTYQIGRIFGYLGNIVHDQGNLKEALNNFQKELESYRSLPESHLQTEKIRRGISIAFEHIGIVYTSLGNYEKALENNTQALLIRKKLSEDFPLNADYRRTVAVSYYNEGEILGNLHKYRESLESYRKDVEIVESLASKDPENEQYRGDIAYGYIRLGDMQIKLGKLQTALKHYQKSEAIRILDVKADPSNLWKKSSLIETNAKICKTLSMTKQIEQTEKHCAETINLMRHTQVEQTNAIIRSFFAETYTNLGDAYLAISKPQRACELYKTGFEIYSDLKNRNLLAKPEIEKPETLLRQIQTCDRDFKV